MTFINGNAAFPRRVDKTPFLWKILLEATDEKLFRINRDRVVRVILAYCFLSFFRLFFFFFPNVRAISSRVELALDHIRTVLVNKTASPCTSHETVVLLRNNKDNRARRQLREPSMFDRATTAFSFPFVVRYFCASIHVTRMKKFRGSTSSLSNLIFLSRPRDTIVYEDTRFRER